MDDETATRLLHRLTSYSPDLEWDQPQSDERLVHGFTSNDLAHRPLDYKQYALPRLPLPRELPPTTTPAVQVLAGAVTVPPTELDLTGLARLLHLSAGVTRTAVRNGYTQLFRAAGSAGARFPLELYVVIPDGTDGLPAGVHWYDPAEHALVEISPSAQGGTPTIVVTGVPWRTGWRYRERGFRHIYWDAGTMLSQLLGLAAAAGLPARLFSRFPDAAVTTLIGADGVQEFPVAVVTLGGGTPALSSASAALLGSFEDDAIEFPLVMAAQQAGAADALGRAWPDGPAVSPPDRTAFTRDADAGPSLDEVVLRRGSMRRMDPAGRLSAAALRASMTVAMRGITVPHWIAVHAVDGIEPGLYRWPDLTRPIRPGDLRQELYTASLEQGLPRDAAFVAIAAIDLAELDDHDYRDAQLAAGLVEGRLHLMAYALGVAASGMTFQDSDIAGLLGAPVDGLLWTCVGVPEYRSRAGGAPGNPATIRMATHRD